MHDKWYCIWNYSDTDDFQDTYAVLLLCCLMPTHTEHVQDEASTSNMLIDFHESLVF